MADEDYGAWYIRGLEWDDPLRIRTPDELINWINELGFLPLFSNEVKGFSVAEHTWSSGWWTDDPAEDPWLWREEIARSGKVAYGKFFNKKAGFISLEWLPVFANYRRDGYDFDSLHEDGKASRREKKIMDLFEEETEMATFEAKRRAGFGKGGEKNFDGVLTDLEMKIYLVGKDFRQKVNKRGEPYGWFVQVLSTPEELWGYKKVTSCYSKKPEDCRNRIFARVKECFPDADEKAIQKVCR